MATKINSVALDKLLVERLKKGDRAAFDEMVTRYWDRIFARVYRLLKNRQDAEEVTQDTFIRAHRGLEKFRGDSSLWTWMLQIATNLAHNKYWYWWRRKRSHSMSLDHAMGGPDNALTLQEVLPAEGETPGETTLTNEFIARIQECMTLLNPKHQQILQLRNVNNLSYEEIAHELGISVGTVKSRIARARENLRVKMGVDFKNEAG